MPVRRPNVFGNQCVCLLWLHTAGTCLPDFKNKKKSNWLQCNDKQAKAIKSVNRLCTETTATTWLWRLAWHVCHSEWSMWCSDQTWAWLSRSRHTKPKKEEKVISFDWFDCYITVKWSTLTCPFSRCRLSFLAAIQINGLENAGSNCYVNVIVQGKAAFL